MRPRHTTAKDGGSAKNAGAVFCPFVLNIAAPAHPCARGIPFVLNIKKAAKGRLFYGLPGSFT
ncbi:MAG: hypothetical protein DSZ32_00040 [Gammaproteobacteria bacterium]|nr:MAG: hypothetical protein DSZ32_00040 [Gammaproteobacteria bacterium]